MTPLLSTLRGGLIVSCQALPGEALFGAHHMAALARAAQDGGAVGIRANSPADIAAIRAAVSLPIVGLWKADAPGFDVYITPRLSDALAVAEAGADMIAVDATDRPRPDAQSAGAFIQLVMRETGRPVLADVATDAEALAAQDAGAAAVSTTLSGYAPGSPQLDGPDLELVRRLAPRLHVPLLAEGRIGTPAEARAALDAGAWAVVVGGAITRPAQITQKFVTALVRPHGE